MCVIERLSDAPKQVTRGYGYIIGESVHPANPTGKERRMSGTGRQATIGGFVLWRRSLRAMILLSEEVGLEATAAAFTEWWAV